MPKNKYLFSSSFHQYSKKNFKYLVLLIWLSFTFHLYAFWGLNVASSLVDGVNDKSPNKQQKIHNIILETKTETLKQSEEAVISDKNNVSQAPIQDKTKPEQYNVVNFQQAKYQGEGGEVSYIPQEVIERKKEKKKLPLKPSRVGIKIKEKVQQQAQQSSEGGGETAPTLYNVKKTPVINLYNTGRSSLATKSKDYADYFIKMQKKIERYHKEFFPIYQYYQGLLKNGEVVVEYNLNRKGDIISAKIVGSYGSDTVDNASLNSIVYAKGFGPLPKELQNENEITIRFHFIYIAR